MNERIFKLALKAMDFQGAVDTDTELKLTNSELEKFAELIVGECIDIAKDVNRNPYLDEHHHARQIIKNITKHFGVEE